MNAIKETFGASSTSVQPPPVMIAAAGDRLLAVAAEMADIITIEVLGTEADIAERVDYIKADGRRPLRRDRTGFRLFPDIAG